MSQKTAKCSTVFKKQVKTRNATTLVNEYNDDVANSKKVSIVQ